jgi:streptogramin lyase
MLGSLFAQAARADADFALSKTAKPEPVCHAATPGNAECLAIRVPTVSASSIDATGPDLEGGGELGGFDSKDLREAYKLPETGGSSQTVAIVDAYNDPYAESDLQKYREKYKDTFKGTETACTEANGCFKKVNQTGETKNYPENESQWSGEISLDLDMASSACPECHILLVEATNEAVSNLLAANEEAVKLKATEVSNSWGALEFSGETSDDKSLDHPSIPILAAAGDVKYAGCDHELGAGVCYPADSRYVIAVGGTKLTKEATGSRKWKEVVWDEAALERGTGSGCSKYETKPPWQTDKGCTKRTDNDVAADASVESPVSVCDSYISGCWEDFGGTSASSPFVAGVEALATTATKLLAADAFYKKPSMLFHVSEGNNGECGSESSETYYLCHATKEGYNGPTGEGTPDGTFESSAAAVATGVSTKVTTTEATLNGVVNPNGLTTKYYFEYGTTETYGKKTEEVSAGSGTSNLEEGKAITGLTKNTSYHFRVVATNSNGTTYGLDEVVTTTGAPENLEPPVASPPTPDRAVPESTTTGTWNNSPTGYEYQWERCNATGGECTTISGATSSKYTPGEADVGHTLVVKVTAKNGEGSKAAHSKATNKVEPIGNITEYSVSSDPVAITSGPDGNLWFTTSVPSKIGKMTTSGTVTEYSLSSESAWPFAITTGPDEDLWFVDYKTNKIGKTPTSVSTITEYGLPEHSNPIGIAAGPDGDLWFTLEGTNKIGKVPTAGAPITEYALPEHSVPKKITAGPDGNLWFADNLSSKIGKITTSGTITEYALPENSFPVGICKGPDGNIWFTDDGSSKIGKITTSGTITEYALPKESGPESIVAGPDGNLWFIDQHSEKIGRITTSGTITEYALPKSSSPGGITIGSDDNVWFTEAESDKIGKITP